jgi:uncharacterized repeat protein (TIGR01451 family)
MPYTFKPTLWIAGAIAVLALMSVALPVAANGPNQQPWAHVPGTCASAVQGAVFAYNPLSGSSGCGGSGTSFDTNEIFPPTVLVDTASASLPCEAGRTSGTCYRMWYVGVDGSNVRRIGYALSPDGITWTRYIGAGVGGSVFEPSGVANTFDRNGVTTMSIVRDGATFRMWYTGIGGSGAIEGIGHATSTNGISWTRVPGSAGSSGAGNLNAVLVERGGSGVFDQGYIVAPSVIIDEASATAPCEAGRTSGTCFRMWYEGVIESPAYSFAIGHAVSPDGVAWTRVLGSGTGAIFSASTPIGSFDDNSVGVPYVIKDGAFYRMWYEAKAYNVTNAYSIGSVVSTDGVTWERPTPNTAVWEGSDDPGVFSPDEVWAVRAQKLGSEYRLWYTVNTRPTSQRFGLATMTPGSAIGDATLMRQGTSYALTYTSAAIPAGGSVMLTLPASIPFGQVTAGSITGFGSATLEANTAAVTDAASGGRARGALLIRLPSGATAGQKTIRFSLASVPASAESMLLQSFNTREVVEYAQVSMTSAMVIADLQISATNGTSSIVAGAATTYTIVATNAGLDTISSIPISAALPGSLTNVSWTCSATAGSTCPASGSTALNTSVTLAAGGQATFLLTGTLVSNATGSVVSSVTLGVPSGIQDPSVPNTASDTDSITYVSDLGVSVGNSSSPLIPGEETTYTITLSNAGPSSVSGATLSATLPSALLNASWSCAASGGASCSAASGVGAPSLSADLPAGQQVVITVNGTLVSSATGQISLSAEAQSPGGTQDLNGGNDTATHTATLVPHADLSIVKGLNSGSNTPGGPINYTISVSNQGPSVALQAVISDLPPSSISAITWTCNATGGSSCAAASGTGAPNVAVDLNVGGQVNLVVSGMLASNATGTLTWTSSVTPGASTVDPILSNNSATLVDQLVSRHDLSMDLLGLPSTAVYETALTYQLRVTNTGPSTATGARVYAEGPIGAVGVTWVCSAQSGASCGSASGVGNVDTLVNVPPGGVVLITVSITTNDGGVSTLEVESSVTGASTTIDPELANNQRLQSVPLFYQLMLPLVVVS